MSARRYAGPEKPVGKPAGTEDASPVVDADWRQLYTIAGVTTFLMLAVVPAQLAVFAVAPPPDTALGWFELFQKSPLLGLLAFEVLFIVYGVLSIPQSVALFAALKRTSRSLMAIFLALSIAGTVALLTARPAFEMLSLSTRYATAATEAQKATLLAAGEAVYATFHGTTYLVSYLLGSLTGLIVSLVMLRSSLFGNRIAYLRMASSLLDFGIFLPIVGVAVSALSAVVLMIWNVLVGVRLLLLGRSPRPSTT
jgi:hypothetical protein